MMSTELPDYVEMNRAHWSRHASEWVAAGERAWVSEPRWGVWGIPNSELPLLPESMAGLDAIELGCGTGYGSAWMCRRGARVVGIDPTEAQLDTARRLRARHGLDIELLLGIAEAVPFPDSSFDFALSEYGAAIWAEPHRWIPEAHRILRPGGRLVFLGNGSWVDVFVPRTPEGVTGDKLINPYFGQYRIDWSEVDPDDPSVEFNMPISDWFRLFKETGFVVEDFWEIQAPPDAGEGQFWATREWARQYPSEQAWSLRKPG